MLRRLFFIFTLLLADVTAAASAKAASDHHALLAAGGAGGWLNVTRPLTAQDMEGRLLLLDFWTYGCINCMQIVPDLEYLEDTFGDKLLIIGVHSAKFSGEQGNERILAAAKRFGLKHPVINDSDFKIWNAFGVRAWPTQVLLGPDGAEIARYQGEGHRADIERDIEKNLDTVAGKTMIPVAGLIAEKDDSGILSFPARLAVSPDGALLYLADSGHNRILAVHADGRIERIIGSGMRGFKNGAAADAEFDHPRGLAFMGGALYVADTGNHALRRIDPASGAVTTAAGSGRKRDPLASPWDVEPLADGHTIAIANAGTHQLFSYDTGTGSLSVLAGSRREDIIDGPAAQAALAQPSGLSRTGDSLFFADAESSALRVLENGTVETLLGTGLFDFGLTDGAYPDAMLQHPQGLYADDSRIVIADTYNNALRIYDRQTKHLSTMTLDGSALHEPGDVIEWNGALFVADTNAHAIRRIDFKTGTVTDFPVRE